MGRTKKNDGMTPQERYHKKVGWISKSYSIKKADADAFAAACEKAGVSQAGQITKMMREFVEAQDGIEPPCNT